MHSGRSFQRWLRAAGPLALVLLAVGLGVHPLVLRPNQVLVGPQHNGNNDLTSYFLAMRTYPAASLARHGETPLWNDNLLSGSPYVGNTKRCRFTK
jgi:hypothetical protein